MNIDLFHLWFMNEGQFCCHLKTKTYLLRLCLKCGRQHFWEEFEEYGKQKLHEGNDDKDHEGHEPEQVGTCPHQLWRK